MIMRLSEIKKIRDPYRLWYEFLKRSRKYQKFCETMRAGKSPEPTEENAKLLDAYFSWGDVFQDSFAKSYKKFKSGRSPVTREAVVDYKADFRKKAMSIIFNHWTEARKRIKLVELINRIERDFKRQTIVLKIDPTRGSDKEILAKVKETLKEKRSQHSTGALQWLECIDSRLTTDRPDMKCLKTSLMVHELRELDMKYPAIAKAFGLPEWGDVERNLKRYNAAAIKLIENAEQGIFPGDYKPSPEDPYDYEVFVNQAP
jgi:hypothetical protein